MNTKIIAAVGVATIIAGSAVVYAQGYNVIGNVYEATSTVSPAPIAPKAAHPIEKATRFEGQLPGPNQALITVDPDLLGQIKQMNARGEWMNRTALISDLHAMTHQKIKADEIGFSIKMTPEMIDLMIDNIQKSPELTDHERVDFLSIAKNWKAGDFSQVDKDHNYFWMLQGGTIGKATGINSAVEEAAYVATYFVNGKQTADLR